MTFREKIASGPVLFDGAMGTYFAEKYDREIKACELANLQTPEDVLRVHREYIHAGCNCIKTNTFAANPLSLECSLDEALQIIDAGWNLACQAAEGTAVSIFADLGPIPQGEAEDYYPLLDRFLALGAENFLLETFSSADLLPTLSAYLKARKPEAFVLTSFAVMPDGFSRLGESAARLYTAMQRDSNTDAVGFNCVSGPSHLRKLISTLPMGKKPLSVMPNAGYPSLVGGRTYYGNSASYYAQIIASLCSDGAQIVGGCCGTNPDYIAHCHEALRELSSSQVPSASTSAETRNQVLPNRIWDKLSRGEKVVAVELDPPANSDIRAFLSGAQALQKAGADAITIADCPVSRARADSSILACKLHRELGIDPIPHLTCRDRNINATKALLLGLNIEGVNNVLVVTGDPVPSAEREAIKSVYNFNSPRLAGFIRDLTPELSNGPFRVYAALNINAQNFDAHINYAKKKIESGVSCFLTQPVHSAEALENLKRAHEELDAKILGGIMPIVSYRNAQYMTGEIAGIHVCDEIVERYRDLDRDQASELAVKITTAIAEHMLPFVDGYYMITPFMRTDLTTKILQHVRDLF